MKNWLREDFELFEKVVASLGPAVIHEHSNITDKSALGALIGKFAEGVVNFRRERCGLEIDIQPNPTEQIKPKNFQP